MAEGTEVTEEAVEKALELPALSKVPTATATTARWAYNLSLVFMIINNSQNAKAPQRS